MANTDAKPIPYKNVAYRVYFPILDADGDLITTAGTLTSQISIDGLTFAAGAAPSVFAGTNFGMYYLDLTQAQMNGDAICIIINSTTVGAKQTPIVLYPQESGDIKVDLQSVDVAGTTGTARGTVNGTGSSATLIITQTLTPAGVVGTPNQFKGRIVTFDNDTTTLALRGQSTDITASTGALLPNLTVTALTTTPVTGDKFSIT